MNNQDQILPISKIVASSQPQNRNFIQSLKPGTFKQFNSHRPFGTDFSFQKDDKSMSLMRQSSSRSRSNVGPGSYEIQSPAHLQSNRPKISIGKGFRSEITKSITNPGPGYYNIPSTQGSKTFIFNSRPNSANSHAAPGPGTYDLNNKSQRSYSFGTARKLQFLNMSNTPGPGAYKIDVKVERKKVDRIERLLKPKIMVRSYYNAKEDKALQEKKAQLTKQKRPKSAYQIKHEQRRRKINKFRQLSKEQCKQPGPGSYEIKDFITEDHVMDKKSGVRQKSLPSEKQKQNIVLGPGTYELRDFLDQPEYIRRGTSGSCFGKSKRFQEQKLSNDLGPGSYEIINDYYY